MTGDISHPLPAQVVGVKSFRLSHNLTISQTLRGIISRAVFPKKYPAISQSHDLTSASGCEKVPRPSHNLTISQAGRAVRKSPGHLTISQSHMCFGL